MGRKVKNEHIYIGNVVGQKTISYAQSFTLAISFLQGEILGFTPLLISANELAFLLWLLASLLHGYGRCRLLLHLGRLHAAFFATIMSRHLLFPFLL